jgi:multidrug transporter EmrE-like cation transporter
VFTWWGLVSGAVFVVSSSFSVTAIGLIGMSAATGVWCGVAVLCSFSWGVLVAGEELASVGKALLALALILAGVAGIALAAWAGGAESGDDADPQQGDAAGCGGEVPGVVAPCKGAAVVVAAAGSAAATASANTRRSGSCLQRARA